MKFIKLFILLIIPYFLIGQWSPAENKMLTEWGENINPDNVLQEYPRPLIERSQWINLNGLWDYAIAEKDKYFPETEGKILVPFAAESSLSGVGKKVGKENALWYFHDFKIPKEWMGEVIKLNFGAVDWKMDLWINDIKVGAHEGGYTPFSFDITPFLKDGESQKITIKVWDPADQGPQPRGKQVINPRGIWYTSVTGIWQTVWLEPVNKTHITNIKLNPDIDHGVLKAAVEGNNIEYGDIIEVNVIDKGQVISTGMFTKDQVAEISISNMHLWSPEDPYLYEVKVNLTRNGIVLDEFKSYTAMRKISSKRDEHGILRMQLNNKDYFQFGLLDQGWWPDGLYTAPSDEALRYDIEKTKQLGYNLIRKHVKVEPARWYTWCDKIGVLVWQDMPSGDGGADWQRNKWYAGNEMKRTEESEAIYRKEWKEIIDFLYSHPSIVSWVPFNEAWGQFKTEEITEWTESYDPSRLINSASGGNHFPVGDITDLHNYPEPRMDFYDGNRITILGEYGGIGLALDGHLWFEDRNWGYVQYKTSEAATDEYVRFGEMLLELVPKGFSAAIYTQTTDVEGEVNGIMTYDRKKIKLEEERISEINKRICNSLKP